MLPHFFDDQELILSDGARQQNLPVGDGKDDQRNKELLRHHRQQSDYE